MFILTLEFGYNAINLFFTWFSVANFCLSFHFLFDVRLTKLRNTESVTTTEEGIFSICGGGIADSDPFYPCGDEVFQLLRGLYYFAMISLVISALGNRPRGAIWLYNMLSIFFAILMVLMLFMGGWSIRLALIQFREQDLPINTSLVSRIFSDNTLQTFRDMVIAVASTIGLYLIGSLIHLDPWHVFTSMIQYMLILPTYTNIFMVYSFCNLHDVSWGTKGATETDDVAPVNRKMTKAGQAVFEYVSFEPEDINDGWNASVKQLNHQKQLREQNDSKRDAKNLFQSPIIFALGIFGI